MLCHTDLRTSSQSSLRERGRFNHILLSVEIYLKLTGGRAGHETGRRVSEPLGTSQDQGEVPTDGGVVPLSSDIAQAPTSSFITKKKKKTLKAKTKESKEGLTQADLWSRGVSGGGSRGGPRLSEVGRKWRAWP